MPTYEYQCKKCGFEFEREQRITEDPIKTCPECKSRQAKRLLSASNFILKGGGWYADGYGSSGKKTAEGSGSDKAEKSSSSDSSTKTDDSKSKTKSKDSSGASESGKKSGDKSSKSKSG